MSQLDDLLAKREELDKAIVKVGKDDFGGMVASLFMRYPDLKNFAWWNEDYSAYNDGDYPGITSLAVNIDTEADYIDLNRIYSWNSRKLEGEELKLHQLQNNVEKELAKYEDLVLQIFGKGGIIVVFEDRIETRDYLGE